MAIRGGEGAEGYGWLMIRDSEVDRGACGGSPFPLRPSLS